MDCALKKTSHGGALGATLLITGCCIGAGMIGFPVVSAAAGFLPSTFAMILCYGFATGTGLLLLEATLWFDRKVNLISMANFALGKGGKVIAWAFFLFLFYCLFVAYIDGGGQLVANLLAAVFHSSIPREAGILACVAFVGGVVYAGTKMVSLVSRLFLLGMISSYLALISVGLASVQSKPLLFMNWKGVILTIPIFLVSFGYQNLIPTLTYYVKRNVRALRFAIFVGNLIPFCLYFLWNLVILGILPETNGIFLAKELGQSDMVTGLLARASESPSVLFFARTFSIFAILTPFIANTMAFVDFLKDGFKLPGKNRYEFVYYLLVLGPPTLLTLLYPRLFLKALGAAGGFADVVLFGILPVTIVWIGRYVKKVKGPYRVAGGRGLLSVVFLLSIGIILFRS